MVFNSRDSLLLFLDTLDEIGFGSQGTCYCDFKENLVYKIFNDYLDDDEIFITYRKEDIMKFSHIENSTFIWPNDVIYVNDKIVGYINNYMDAKNLYKINPLMVNLDDLIRSIENVKEDLLIISNRGVKIFDIMYNLLYSKGKLVTTDVDEYGTNDTSLDLYRCNKERFYNEIFLFLVDSYFDEFVGQYKILNELYQSRADVIQFIIQFRKKLSELKGYDVNNLYQVSEYRNKQKVRAQYIRNLKY